MSEFDRIAAIRARFGALAASRSLEARGALTVRSGDDAAVLPAGPRDGALVLSVDAAVEGVHFDLRWIDVTSVAARAVEAALSDLAAMGADADANSSGATGVLCAWTLPRACASETFDALIEGTARACDRSGVAVLGGNLSAGPVLSLTTTVLGRMPSNVAPVARHGARVGDVLALTGPVGRASLGLRALQRGLASRAALRPFVEAWRCPQARLDCSSMVRAIAHAAIDVSDGLAADAAHLAEAARCALEFDGPAIVGCFDGATVEAAATLETSPLEAALYGGEDYELLLCCSPEQARAAGLLIVGRVGEGDGVWLRSSATTTRQRIDARGWDHFAGR